VLSEPSRGAGIQAGEIVPQSGIYTITHDALHADIPHEVTVIKGRRFSTCRHCPLQCRPVGTHRRRSRGNGRQPFDRGQDRAPA